MTKAQFDKDKIMNWDEYKEFFDQFHGYSGALDELLDEADGVYNGVYSRTEEWKIYKKWIKTNPKFTKLGKALS